MRKEEEIDLLILRSLANKLNKKEDMKLKQWVHQSKENKFYYERLKTELAPKISKPEFNIVAARELLLQKIKQRGQSKYLVLNWYKWGTIAASLLFITFTTFYIIYSLQPSWKSYSTIAETKNITLKDGSKVRLYGHSTLKVLTSEGKQRIVKLQGEAFFEVSKNKHKPFLVKTQDLEVQVLGTSFQVNAHDSIQHTSVTLVEGSVQIKFPFSKKSERLVPNQRLLYHKNSKKIQLQNYNAEKVVARTKNIILFKNDSLAEIAERLSNYFGVKISIKDKKLSQKKLTTKFKFTDPLEDILEVVCLSTNTIYHYERNKSQYIIQKK